MVGEDVRTGNPVFVRGEGAANHVLHCKTCGFGIRVIVICAL